MDSKNINTEQLRQKLLNEIYAMTFSGLPAAALDEAEIKKADDTELFEIAKRYGVYV